MCIQTFFICNKSAKFGPLIFSIWVRFNSLLLAGCAYNVIVDSHILLVSSSVWPATVALADLPYSLRLMSMYCGIAATFVFC